MKAETLHIENPSKNLLKFVRNLRTAKETHKANLLAKKEIYFKK